MVDDIRRKKTGKLVDRGFLYLQEEKFKEALEISKQLEKLRFTAAFDIGAQAYRALGNMDKAIETLKRGIEIEPNCWPNLQMLGNYLSDIEEYEDAELKYEQALECSGVWKDSIRLNQAILANRQNKYDRSLTLLAQIEDDELQFHVAETKVASYRSKGLIKEAIKLAEESIQKWKDDEETGDVIARLSASIGRMRLTQGSSKTEVREWAFDSLEYDESNEMLLALIRDIDDRYSASAQYFRFLVHCMIPFTHPSYKDAIGYFETYDVVADTKDEALNFIREFEDEDFRMNITVEEYEIIEPRPDSPKGVYWHGGRAFYKKDN